MTQIDSAIKSDTLQAAVEEFGLQTVLGWFADEAIRRLVSEIADSSRKSNANLR
jgi:hypothetical protein